MADSPDRTESIFAAAVACSSTADRQLYLDQACAGDAALRARIEALLRAHDRAGHLLDKPVPDGLDQTQVLLPNEKPGAIISGRYKLIEAIGEGGMGSVWVAEQKEPVKRKVAIKLVKAGMDSRQVLARFEAERQALAMMDHPNIAKVFDGGMTEQGRPFFVMEYVKGVPLTEYCDQAKLSLKERLQLFLPICQAVQHAHQKGIIHRDLKPSNILICLYDGKPVPKVIDFGLAKAMHQALTDQSLYTAHGMMVGTPLYMSPEQAEHNNLDVDTRTDIYSLGVILYELLTGSTPLERQQLKEAAYNEILRLIKEVEPPKPSTRLSSSQKLPNIAAQRSIEPNQLKRSVTGDLDWIVMKALDKERSRRYETANGLSRDVERFLNDEAVEARPPSMIYKLNKFARRNRLAFFSAGVVVAALIIGTAVATWQAFRAANAEVAAAADRDRAIDAERDAQLERDRAIVEKVRADENFAMARKAVDDYLRNVTNDQDLKDRTDFTSLRKRLLDSAVPFYQQFASQRGDDPKSRAESARIYYTLGNVQTETGDWVEAAKSFTAAWKVYAELVALQPESLALRTQFTNLTNELAYAEIRGNDTVSANQHYAEAVRLAEQLVVDFPMQAEAIHIRAVVHLGGEMFGQALPGDVIVDLRELTRLHPSDERYLASLAATLGLVAGQLVENGKTAESIPILQEQVAIHRRMLATRPNDPSLRHQLANGLFNYGAFIGERPADALPLREEAGTLLRQLVIDFSSNVRYRHMLARNQNAVGLLQLQLGHVDEAIPALREALLLMEQLPDNYPSPGVHRWRRAEFAKDLAAGLGKQQLWSEAITYLDKALDLLTSPPDLSSSPFWSASLHTTVELLTRANHAGSDSTDAPVKLQGTIESLRTRGQTGMALMLAAACVRNGLVEEATSVAKAIGDAETSEVNDLYNAGCIFSLASAATANEPTLSKEYADRAIAQLERAVSLGWKDADHMMKDADLEPLRDREDFQQLVKSLEATAARDFTPTVTPGETETTIKP